MSSEPGDASRRELLSRLFAQQTMPKGYGHEVSPGLFLANVHALRDESWLSSPSVRADAVIVVAAELGAPGGVYEVLTSLRARAPPVAVEFIPMEEATAEASAGGAAAGAPRRLGVSEAYAAALRRQLVAAADVAAAHLAAGRRVVVACRFGCNRSASTVLTLFARHRGTPMLDGLAALRAVRPKVYPNIETWPALLEIEVQARGATSISEQELLDFHAWAPARRPVR